MKSVFSMALAVALIYVGTTFLSGQLLPVSLGSFYRVFPSWIKIALFLILFSLPANLLIAWAFRESGATFAAVVYSVFVVIGAVVTAMLVDGARISINAAIAFGVMILSAAWGIVELRKTIAS